MTEGLRNVSDTALWVAMYRAMETDRPDALFKDPFARELAGPRGEAILDDLPQGRQSAWPMIVRTQVFDELILERVRQGADPVLNLAAGLDTRPYRLELPSALRWIEVDLPEMISYKAGKLAGNTPRCRLERAALDLSDRPARRRWLDGAVPSGAKALVVTEGLLVYLEPAAVQTLADDLAAHPGLRWWLVDYASPALLKMLEKRWRPQLSRAGSEFKFGLDDPSAFFAGHGWRALENRLVLDEARRLGREMPYAGLWRLLGRLMSKATREKYRRMSGYVLLEKAREGV